MQKESIQNEKQTKKRRDVRVTFRLYDAEDIVFFERFKKELIATGDTLSSAIAGIIRNHLLGREKKVVWKHLQDDMFYAFRKALFASLIPFSKKINEKIDGVLIENNIINAKLNMLLNANSQKTTLNEELLNYNSNNLTDEPQVFENARIVLNAKLQKEREKKKIKAKEIEKAQKNFENYSKNSDDLDPEILQDFRDSEDVYDDDL